MKKASYSKYEGHDRMVRTWFDERPKLKHNNESEIVIPESSLPSVIVDSPKKRKYIKRK